MLQKQVSLPVIQATHFCTFSFYFMLSRCVSLVFLPYNFPYHFIVSVLELHFLHTLSFFCLHAFFAPSYIVSYFSCLLPHPPFSFSLFQLFQFSTLIFSLSFVCFPHDCFQTPCSFLHRAPLCFCLSCCLLSTASQPALLRARVHCVSKQKPGD